MKPDAWMVCPNCLSTDLEGDSYEYADELQAYQTVRCLGCGAEWNEVYQAKERTDLWLPG